jgi:hypothetical protein
VNQSAKSNIYILIALLVIIQGVFFFKFFAVLFLIPYLLKYNVVDQLKVDLIGKFYIYLLLIGVISYILESFFIGFAINSFVLFLFSSFLWIFYFLVYLTLKKWAATVSKREIDWVIHAVFYINALFCLVQYFILIFKYKSINPFTTELATSAGDEFVGVFANSSVNMFINAFFLIHFISSKKKTHYLIASATLLILLTSYMSGILCLCLAILIFFLLNKRVKLKIRLISIVVLSVSALVFYLISYDNIIYAASIIESVFTINPPRKITSFYETFTFLFSGIKHFFIGASPSHFSSRVAFIGGGEFVNWYPDFLVFRSVYFDKSHFQLWNYAILSIPFNDGTANQPFSIYNQMIGEYGLVGFLILIFFYFKGVYKGLESSPYSFLLLLILVLFFFIYYLF